MNIFLVQNGEATGPFPEADVRVWLADGTISSETFATVEGLDEWKPLIEILPDQMPPALDDSPPQLPAAPLQEGEAEDEVDPNADEPDARRYEPEKEERLRSFAWVGVAVLFLMAFLWPTKIGDGYGVLNFQFEWANKNLGGASIPLMIWPGLAALIMGAAAFLLKGRLRAGLTVFISLIPLVLVLVVGGAGFANVMKGVTEVQQVDVTNVDAVKEAAEKSKSVLEGLAKVIAAGGLVVIIGGGILSTIYLSILMAPSAIRHFRPNSKGAYYFGLIGGIFLVLFQLLMAVFMLFSFFGGILNGLGMMGGMLAQIAAVVMSFINTLSKPAKVASKRALITLTCGAGGLVLIGLTLLIVPLIDGGTQATIGMYVFKFFLWFTAAAMVVPLGVMDLWLGKASDTPQNN